MKDSGLYWKFIGWTQIVAAVLLMSQRFSKLGTLIFFGLIFNIFVITVAYKFTGTPIVAGLMQLATTYLLVWDYRSFLFLIQENIELKPIQLKVINHSFGNGLAL